MVTQALIQINDVASQFRKTPIQEKRAKILESKLNDNKEQARLEIPYDYIQQNIMKEIGDNFKKEKTTTEPIDESRPSDFFLPQD